MANTRPLIALLLPCCILPLLTESQTREKQVISVRDYGAIGDCKRDDTKPVARAVAAANAASGPVVLLFPPARNGAKARYCVNPVAIAHSGKEWAGFVLKNDHVEIDGKGSSLEVFPNLSLPSALKIPPSETWLFVMLHLEGSFSTVHHLTVNSNGSCAAFGNKTSGAFWCSGVLFSPQEPGATYSGAFKRDNSIRNCRFGVEAPPQPHPATGLVNYGGLMGWPARGDFQQNFEISGNYAIGSEGMGAAGEGDHILITKNTSINGYDAHFFCNGPSAPQKQIDYCVIDNNDADFNVNGSGIDITATNHFTVTNNRVRENGNWGILVTKTWGPYIAWTAKDLSSNHGLVANNILYKNGWYQGWGNDAEIAIGDADYHCPSSAGTCIPAGAAANDVTVRGNTITTQERNGTGVAISWGATGVRTESNKISGCGNPGGNGTPIRPGLPCDQSSPRQLIREQPATKN